MLLSGRSATAAFILVGVLAGCGPQQVRGRVGREVVVPAVSSNHYDLTVSDPSCGYCSWTGTSYLTARSPLGPWEFRGKISETSCSGQPAAVTKVSRDQYVYQTDRWKNIPNETAADQWWGLLRFDGTSILPIDCGQDSFRVKPGGLPAGRS